MGRDAINMINMTPLVRRSTQNAIGFRLVSRYVRSAITERDCVTVTVLVRAVLLEVGYFPNSWDSLKQNFDHWEIPKTRKSLGILTSATTIRILPLKRSKNAQFMLKY